jgi:hypothetical protein
MITAGVSGMARPARNSLTPPLKNQRATGLFDPVLQRLAGPEDGDVLGFDGNLLAGLGIDADLGFPMGDGEGAEADQRYFAFFLEAGGDGIQESVDHFFRFGNFQVRVFGNGFYQFGFVHHYLLPRILEDENPKVKSQTGFSIIFILKPLIRQDILEGAFENPRSAWRILPSAGGEIAGMLVGRRRFLYNQRGRR